MGSFIVFQTACQKMYRLFFTSLFHTIEISFFFFKLVYKLSKLKF